MREFVLELPELPGYPTVHLVDIAWCLFVAAAVAAVVVACQFGAGYFARKSDPRGAAARLVGGGLPAATEGPAS